MLQIRCEFCSFYFDLKWVVIYSWKIVKLSVNKSQGRVNLRYCRKETIDNRIIVIEELEELEELGRIIGEK